MRASRVYLRTSRKGPGGWTNPTLSTVGRGALEARGAQRGGPQNYADGARTGPAPHRHIPTSRSNPPLSFLSSASFYDAGDNPQQQAMSAEGAQHNNWRTDRRFSALPSQYRNIGLRGQPFSGVSGEAGASDPNDTGSARRVGRDPAAQAEKIRGSSSSDGGAAESGAGADGASSWLGGRGHGNLGADPSMSRNRGMNDFSMIDRDEVTVTSFLRMLMDATFQPRDADSKVFGGDNRSKLAEQREELKNLDPRLVPFAHEDVMNDYLKNIQQLHSPSGQIVSRDMLKGRFVGLFFFSESERCFRVMRHLQAFHRAHSPDFVAVAVSVGGKEMIDVTRGFGFFHCTHRDGATWVQRDAGIMIRPLSPLPKIVVVDGTTGHEVCRSGLTAVLARPDTCFAAWKRGESGIGQFDWLKAMYI